MSTISPGPPSAIPEGWTVLPPFEHEGHYEVLNGRIVEKPAMGVYEAHLASALLSLLFQNVSSNRLGRLELEMLFVIDASKDLKYRPDLAFVSYERWASSRPVPRTEAWDVIPDLAVEIVSPTNYASKVITKVNDYFRYKVKCVWVVYPIEQQVYVYESPTSVQILTLAETLECPAILPGLQLPLAQLFEADAPSP
jgi:Uma2 family endonuclease